MSKEVTMDTRLIDLTFGELMAAISESLRHELSEWEKPEPLPKPEENLNLAEVAELLGHTTKYIYQLVWKQRIPCYKRDGRLVFKRSEVEAWIEDELVKRNTKKEVEREADTYIALNKAQKARVSGKRTRER